ncbi:MAG: hypothetical protein ACR2Q3_16685 [Woeseiaceae bacterium]
MPKSNDLLLLCAIVPVFLSACSNDAEKQRIDPVADTPPQQATNTNSPVADDVLFVVLGKMALYDQEPAGDLVLRNHHFVAEIMPKAGRKIVAGTLADANDETKSIEFNPEGNAFMAHGARVSNPDELHQVHPDGAYVFSYQTESGQMDSQVLNLRKRDYINGMPAPARVSALQNGSEVDDATIDASADLELSWESMPGNTKVPDSELADLVFVLAFDCFGNNIAHSGRPYQGGPFLTYEDSTYVIPADVLMSGLHYTVIVEQATADVDTTLGVPGIATYATLTFLEFETSGQAVAEECPVAR